MDLGEVVVPLITASIAAVTGIGGLIGASRAQKAARHESDAARQLAQTLADPRDSDGTLVLVEGKAHADLDGLTATAHSSVTSGTGEMALILRLDRLSLAVEQLVAASQHRPSRWRWAVGIAQGVSFLASVATVVALFWTYNH